MANVRDSDTSLWLHNKLGTSNDSWTGGSICTQLNAEVLRNIKDCFPDLQPQVKLKLLLSFFHIPRRNVEEWRAELEEIMEVAGMDSELWVSMLAEVMKTLPSSGSLNTPELDEARPVFSDMVSELRRLVNRHSELAMLPLECHYLNKAALVSVVGQQPNPIKHFTLKRKPKSAALRAELLQKSSDAVSNLKKCIAPTVPIRSRGMPRKMTDTTPLKGLPSRWTIGRGGVRVAGRPTPPQPTRKDGGIKLLDIADQPATQHQKKRRRMLEMEENQKRAAAEAEALPSTAATPAGLSPSLTPATLPSPDPALAPPAPLTPSSAATARNTVPAGASSALPEYARGLNNYVMPSTPAAPPPGSLTPNANRETGIPVQMTSVPPAITPITPASVQSGAVVSHPQIIKIHNADPPPLAPSPKSPLVVQSQGSKPIIIGQQQKLLITGQPGQKPLLVTAGPGGTLLSGSNILKNAAGLPVILTNSVLHHAQGQAGKTVVLTSVKQAGGVQHHPSGNVIIQTQQVLPAPSATATRPSTVERTVTAAQPPNLLPRRGLSLTRDQMLEAQDMFRNANRVTRPEKALILGFMAGSRENPCPNLGNIVTIKLSENQENVLQKDNSQVTMMCETHFQMNYNNGQWMRIKKYRPLESVTPQTGVPQQVS